MLSEVVLGITAASRVRATPRMDHAKLRRRRSLVACRRSLVACARYAEDWAIGAPWLHEH